MLYLIRHASAGRRTGGSEDGNRPLDDVGRAQAVRIATWVERDQIEVVLSSPALRCCQTVTPLAAQLGTVVEISDALYEGRGATMALELVQQLAGKGTAAALCSHGDVIPHLLDLLAADGTRTDGYGCAKASVWTLTVNNGDITKATYTPAP